MTIPMKLTIDQLTNKRRLCRYFIWLDSATCLPRMLKGTAISLNEFKTKARFDYLLLHGDHFGDIKRAYNVRLQVLHG